MGNRPDSFLPSPEGPRIRGLFARISPRYDLANRLLSLSIDRLWRRKTVRILAPGPGQRVLDLFCGTGDLTRALTRRGSRVVGADFCPEMIFLARRKWKRRPPGHSTGGVWAPLFVGADAHRLPFPDDHFDLVTAAFGIRNLEDPDRGLGEMVRVVRTGGRVGILEFSRPTAAWLRALYGVYLRWIVPPLGGWVTGDTSSYTYLSRSIEAFPDQERFKDRMRTAGLETVTHYNLSGGIAALHVGKKPEMEVPDSESCRHRGRGLTVGAAGARSGRAEAPGCGPPGTARAWRPAWGKRSSRRDPGIAPGPVPFRAAT